MCSWRGCGRILGHYPVLLRWLFIFGVVLGMLIAWLIVFDFPSEASREVGVYLALAGAVAVATGTSGTQFAVGTD